MALALVRDLRELREPSSAEEIEAFETDVLAGFVLARASAGLVDSTIRNDISHLEYAVLGGLALAGVVKFALKHGWRRLTALRGRHRHRSHRMPHH